MCPDPVAWQVVVLAHALVVDNLESATLTVLWVGDRHEHVLPAFQIGLEDDSVSGFHYAIIQHAGR